MNLSEAGRSAIRATYNRKIDTLAEKVTIRNIRVLIFRIVESTTISRDDKCDLLQMALLIAEEDVATLLDLKNDIYGDLFDALYGE